MLSDISTDPYLPGSNKYTKADPLAGEIQFCKGSGEEVRAAIGPPWVLLSRYIIQKFIGQTLTISTTWQKTFDPLFLRNSSSFCREAGTPVT